MHVMFCSEPRLASLKSQRPASGSRFQIERITAFDFLSPEYRALFDSSDASAFEHPLWLSTLYDRLVPHFRVKPTIIVGRCSSDGRLAFVLPLLERRFGPLHIAEYADLRVSDYCGAIHDPAVFSVLSADPSAHTALLRELRAFTLVVARKSRSDALLPSELWNSKAFTLSHAHETAIFLPFQSWRSQALDPSFSRFLDRKRKRLSRIGQVRFQILTTGAEVEKAFTFMRNFRGQRFPKTDLLQQQKYFDFYKSIAMSGLDVKFARTYSLTLDGQIVAVVFGLSHRQRFLFLLLGFDSVGLRNHSVGLLALEDTIKDCAERGDRVFDMTVGDEPYKNNFASIKTPMFTQWTANGPFGYLAGTAWKNFLQVRSILKRKTSKAETATALLAWFIGRGEGPRYTNSP